MTKEQKKLILIRHGRSTANEYFDQVGNRWGDATFQDDPTFVDARMSEHGQKQAHTLREILDSQVLPSLLTDPNSTDKIEEDPVLIVSSPLTRALETCDIALLSCRSLLKHRNVKIVAHPLATERVYTASDTGRPVHDLRKEFPHIDFDSAFHDYYYSYSKSYSRNKNEQPEPKESKWWFTLNSEDQDAIVYEEWRPNGEGQFYAVHGEPLDIFHERMVSLFQWLQQRKERTIVLVTHWAVIRWFSGKEVENCEALVLDLEECSWNRSGL